MENNMKYYKDNQGTVYAYEADGSQDYLIGDKVAMTDEEVEAHLNPPKTQVEIEAELISHFKSLYMNVVQTKLSELDYDSLATVKLWEGDATFGAEASAILAWYKSIISYNYATLNDVKTGATTIPTDSEYLAGIPAYVGVV